MDELIVHVVDDDAGLRDSLAFLLESAGRSVATYEDAATFLASGSHESGCLITDVRMPGMTGIELIQALRKRGDMRTALVITGHGDVPLAVEAMKEGALDFLQKPFDDTTFLAAVERAMALETERRAPLAVMARLTARERDVLAGIVEGKINKVIAHDLGISPRTVEIYRANLMSKTGAASVSDLIKFALQALGR